MQIQTDQVSKQKAQVIPKQKVAVSFLNKISVDFYISGSCTTVPLHMKLNYFGFSVPFQFHFLLFIEYSFFNYTENSLDNGKD